MVCMDRLTSDKVFEHWMKCQNPKDPNYKIFESLGKEKVFKYNTWELKQIHTKEILNYIGTGLENSGPLREKINNFLSHLENVFDLPPIVVVPIDIVNKKPFLEKKYEDKELKWEVADGIHRLHLTLDLGIKKIWAYVPVGE